MYDVIILGAGSAGLTAASIFKKTDINYLIVHHGFKGTTCARYGCMPSKALIQVAKSYHERHKFQKFGISGADKLSIDIGAALQHVRALRDDFTGGIINNMHKYNVVYGKPQFTDGDTVEVAGRQYKAKSFILCTGSSPRIPELYQPYQENILTNDNLFDQDELPRRIAVIGLGAIGVELGQALARLGIHITAINRSKEIAGLKDPEILQSVRDALSVDMELILETEVENVSKTDGGYILQLNKQTVECDRILLAAGRTANIAGLNLREIGVKFNDRGMPDFDLETLKIKDYPLYMAGDSNAYKAVLHESHDEAAIIAAQILNKALPQRRVPLRITFSEPNIAQIGQQPDEITEAFITGSVSYTNQGRARIMAENQGMLKLYVSKESDRILGACMAAPAGEHMAHLLSLAIQQEMTVAELLRFPFYHPVVEEGIRTALREIDDQKRDCITDMLC